MMGIELVGEMEDLLLDKLDKQKKCLSFYEFLDESVRQDLIVGTFNQIDNICMEIQSIDLVFVSKLEKLKRMYSVCDLNDLPLSVQKSFIIIKKAVVKIAEYERLLGDLKKNSQEFKSQVSRNFLDSSRKASAASAYKNIIK